MKNRLEYILFIFALAFFLLSGCAHDRKKGSTPHFDPTAVSPVSQDQDISLSEETPSDLEMNDEFFDEFEEEYKGRSGRVADPLSPWNRAMFHFNDKFYFWLLKPVSKGYKAIVPEVVRIGVSNFFCNLGTPIRLTSCLLQGKMKATGTELVRFLMNSTVGVLGFGDPAQKCLKLDITDEDLGQTLGVYGIGNGFYVVWPLLGPSTLRDSVGMVGDWFLDPVLYVEPFGAKLGILSYEKVNETSFRIGDYESIRDAAIEPYEAFRDAYIQYRKTKVEK